MVSNGSLWVCLYVLHGLFSVAKSNNIEKRTQDMCDQVSLSGWKSDTGL